MLRNPIRTPEYDGARKVREPSVHELEARGSEKTLSLRDNRKLAMDETRTLSILGWTIGGVVATVFILNAIALALI